MRRPEDYASAGTDGPFVIYADKDDKPGKVEMLFVRFERRVFDAAAFDPGPVAFDRLDHANPNVMHLKNALEMEA